MFGSTYPYPNARIRAHRVQNQELVFLVQRQCSVLLIKTFIWEKKKKSNVSFIYFPMKPSSLNFSCRNCRKRNNFAQLTMDTVRPSHFVASDFEEFALYSNHRKYCAPTRRTFCWSNLCTPSSHGCMVAVALSVAPLTVIRRMRSSCDFHEQLNCGPKASGEIVTLLVALLPLSPRHAPNKWLKSPTLWINVIIFS